MTFVDIDLNKYVAVQNKRIEEHLDRLIPEQSTAYNALFRAARYSLLGAGKRLRPILALAVTETLGGDVEAALAPACALEMIHTYSLIHDDLPCMDDDDFRRGKPSLHKVFPEGHAVLAGDFLLTHAFAVLAEAPLLSSEQRIKLVSTLARQSGGDGMIAGQVMDLAAEGKKIDLETLRLIHRNKTGAMIVASLEFGGIVCGASDAYLEILHQFGQDIGLAFQIIDDVLDVTASEKKHGKKIASDLANDKSTYVSLLGLEQSKAMAQALYHTATQKLQQLPCDVSLLIQLADLMIKRTY